ncbi:GNAT family N-acetyltransferase [Staphylococcus saccharolyticus]|uniref:GNAT family N-acetyltransferase n=1 Tax=Staphylococcus saccharolyticus TaxID=33028 RepID=UPI001932A4F2|nr:GNAT family N-acetyltransferase [Staphylococcus saccharolyticus]MBL7639483.1 GNAT family N-acetyltransferase [Staphylococcus saccharolyticus]
MFGVTFKDIYIEGQQWSKDSRKIIYLTPHQPLQYASNTWIYQLVPTMTQWLKDIQFQQRLHLNQSSNHLSFYFPENESLNQQWLDIINRHEFELGLMELYVIEGQTLMQLSINEDVYIERVTTHNIEDYLYVYDYFARPYGEEYTYESRRYVLKYFLVDKVERLIAYIKQHPVGIVNLIITDRTVEIDGFGVLEAFRHQGVGSTLQSFIGHLADQRPVILVADGEDTAKHMYVKQGYIFQGYRYQVLKENII